MLAPCEVAVKCALPSVRAMVANELMSRHNLKQVEAAKLLGISQPAISLYQKKLRGHSINLSGDPEIHRLVENHANYLVTGNATYKATIASFCSICTIIKAKGFLCKIHKALDPTVDLEECDFCKTATSSNCP